MTTALAILPETISSKLKKGKLIYKEILGAEDGLRHNHGLLLHRAWYLGEIITDLKEEIGHGKFLLWLEGSWPELGERNAQRCMQFFKANPQVRLAPNPRNSTDLGRAGQANFGGTTSVSSLDKQELVPPFDNDSVRKFFWHYIPAKERPALDGDESVSSKPHYLSFVNHFRKWDRQLGLGHVPMPPLAQFRREMESPLKRIIEIGGKDWAAEILNI